MDKDTEQAGTSADGSSAGVGAQVGAGNITGLGARQHVPASNIFGSDQW